jgi:5-methylthioadenosine/S-adenosylhomocysteine deaminase
VPGLSELLPADLRRTVEEMQPAPTKGLLELTERAIRRWHGSAEGRVQVAVAPTIPNQATDELLDGCAALALEYGVGIHTHLAESKVQVVESRRRWGKSIVARLAEHRVLGPGFVGAHSVWLDDDDLRMLADAGAAVAHNPGSNLRLGVGIAPVREMLDHGLAVGLGTDGSTCADNQNLFEALRIASVISTIRFPHETARWLDADTVWGLATSGTARVMGQPGDLGALAQGRKADLVLLRTDSIFLRPLADPVKALVYAETGASVDTVLVDGRVVLDQGRVTTVDETRIYARAQEAADRHRERAADAWALAGRLAPYVAAACRGAVTMPLPINRFAAPTPAS